MCKQQMQLTVVCLPVQTASPARIHSAAALVTHQNLPSARRMRSPIHRDTLEPLPTLAAAPADRSRDSKAADSSAVSRDTRWPEPPAAAAQAASAVTNVAERSA